jgi:hypothetical protein
LPVKYLIAFSLILVLSAAALAETRFMDVPEGHWATEAVYELVKMGVTEGYPDGTFRGKKNISRFEIASFLSKLAGSINRERGADEKLIQELKTEAALIKYGMDKADKETKFSGVIESRASGSTIIPRCGRMDYRLKLNLLKTFDEESSLKIGLDTVDAGFNTEAARDLATRLIDVESRFRLGGLDYKVNLGPGVVVHTDSFFPSENYMIYIRPKTAIEASKQIGKLSCSASYVTRQVETSGKIGVHELTGKLKYKFGNLAVSFQPRYLFEIDGPSDILAEAGLNYVFNEYWHTYLLWSVGNFQEGNSGMYAKVIQKILDPLKTGTTIVLRFDKVGSKYRDDYLDEYEFIYLNNFDRLILDGSADLGIRLTQKLINGFDLELKSDYVTNGNYQYGESYPETYFLWQLGLNYKLSSRIGLSAFYKSYNVPSGMAQFSDPVPALSEVIGFGATCAF